MNAAMCTMKYDTIDNVITIPQQYKPFIKNIEYIKTDDNGDYLVPVDYMTSQLAQEITKQEQQWVIEPTHQQYPRTIRLKMVGIEVNFCDTDNSKVKNLIDIFSVRAQNEVTLNYNVWRVLRTLLYSGYKVSFC